MEMPGRQLRHHPGHGWWDPQLCSLAKALRAGTRLQKVCAGGQSSACAPATGPQTELQTLQISFLPTLLPGHKALIF